MPNHHHKKKILSFSQKNPSSYASYANLFIIFFMGGILGYLFSGFQNTFLVSFPTYSSQAQVCLSPERDCEKTTLTIIDKTGSEIFLKINSNISSNIISTIHKKNLIKLIINAP